MTAITILRAHVVAPALTGKTLPAHAVALEPARTATAIIAVGAMTDMGIITDGTTMTDMDIVTGGMIETIILRAHVVAPALTGKTLPAHAVALEPAQIDANIG